MCSTFVFFKPHTLQAWHVVFVVFFPLNLFKFYYTCIPDLYIKNMFKSALNVAFIWFDYEKGNDLITFELFLYM